jgi:hypothetical protein
LSNFKICISANTFFFCHLCEEMFEEDLTSMLSQNTLRGKNKSNIDVHGEGRMDLLKTSVTLFVNKNAIKCTDIDSFTTRSTSFKKFAKTQAPPPSPPVFSLLCIYETKYCSYDTSCFKSNNLLCFSNSNLTTPNYFIFYFIPKSKIKCKCFRNVNPLHYRLVQFDICFENKIILIIKLMLAVKRCILIFLYCNEKDDKDTVRTKHKCA